MKPTPGAPDIAARRLPHRRQVAARHTITRSVWISGDRGMINCFSGGDCSASRRPGTESHPHGALTPHRTQCRRCGCNPFLLEEEDKHMKLLNRSILGALALILGAFSFS